MKKYPKSEKFALVSEIKQTLYLGLRNLLFAIKSFNKYDKLKYYLSKMGVNFCGYRI